VQGEEYGNTGLVNDGRLAYVAWCEVNERLRPGPLFVAGLGAIACLYATHRGPDRFYDSEVSFEGARHLAGRAGLRAASAR